MLRCKAIHSFCWGRDNKQASRKWQFYEATQKLKDTLVWVTATQATAHKSSRTLVELEKIFVKKKKVTSWTYMTHIFGQCTYTGCPNIILFFS